MSQESNQSSEYIPSQSTPESEDYTSYESSSLETPSENSEYSIVSSGECSGSADYNSSYYDDSDDNDDHRSSQE